MRPGAANAKPRIVVMGVSGSGKTTVGESLALLLDVPFSDADGLHPEANVRKMAHGIALTDADRAPWLDSVARTVASATDTGLVLACSALRRRYRDIIRSDSSDVVFVELELSASVLTARLRERKGHFMAPSLLDSQLATLESLEIDERGFRVSAIETVPEVADRIAGEITNRFPRSVG